MQHRLTCAKALATATDTLSSIQACLCLLLHLSMPVYGHTCKLCKVCRYTEEACSAAAATYGRVDTGVGVTTFPAGRPYGCYYYGTYLVQDQRLWLNLQENANRDSDDTKRTSFCASAITIYVEAMTTAAITLQAITMQAITI